MTRPLKRLVTTLIAAVSLFGTVSAVPQALGSRVMANEGGRDAHICPRGKVRMARSADGEKLALSARVVEVAVRSETMQKDVPTTVMLPSGYETRTDDRFPVVYLLHGSGNDQKTYACEPVISLADRIGAIVVAPYGDASWWLDSPRLPKMRYETFVTQELVPYIDAHYRTVADRSGRAIAGHSMGGHGACFVGFGHTDLFGAVGNAMGGVDLRPFSGRKDLVKLLGEKGGYPDDWTRSSAITRAAGLKNGEVQFTTVVGTGDFFFGVNRAMHDLLSSNGVAHVHMEVCGKDKEHSSHTRTFAYEAMKTLFARFGEFFKGEK